jgi:peptidoglycan/xylan/chitin deacetylase (PgdA/CDA1 family)
MTMLAFLLACSSSPSPQAESGNPALLASAVAADFVLEARNGVDAQVFDTYNAANGTNQITLFDGSWGSSVNLNQYKILVSIGSDGLIDAVRPYGVTGALSIPSGGYVVAVNGTALPYLNGLVVDDELHVLATSSCSPLSSSVPVILIHDIGTSGSNLEATLQAIDKAGFTTITLEQLQGFLEGQIGLYDPDPDPCDDTPRLPENPIVITFDDAYTSQFTYAPALLDSYGMVATFFVITSYPGSLSWVASWSSIADAVSTYPDAVELGCHSHAAHVQVSGVAKYLTMTDAERLADMQTCRDTLEKHTGVVPTAIAWPFGSYDEDLIETARKAGFETMWNTWPGLNVPENDDAEGHVRRFGVNVANPWSTADATLDRWRVCP